MPWGRRGSNIRPGGGIMGTYLSASGILTGLNPDILPELSESDFVYSAPSAIRRSVDIKGDGTDFHNKSITGSFMVDDTRNDPGALFISAYRAGPLDGQDLARYYSGYGIVIMPLNAQAAVDGRPNLFVVDNSLATRKVVLENVVHTGWGDMAYLASVSVTMDPDVEYSFDLRYGAGGTLEFYMAPKGSAMGAAKITYGAYQHQAQGTYWGVSASYTDGYTWSVDNLSLSNLNPKYSTSLHLLDGSIFTDDFEVVASGFGEGYDPLNPLGYGIIMYVLDNSTDPATWTPVDSHTEGPGGSFAMSSGSLDLATYVSTADSYVRVLFVIDYPSDFDNRVEGYLSIDTVYAHNWNTGYVNVGGKGDIYLHESSQPSSYQIDMYNVDASEWLTAVNSKIQGDHHLPMVWIPKVEQINGAGVVIATLTLGIDYTIDVYDEYRTFSSDEQKKILFAAPGINVRITYQTFDNVETVQEYVDDEYRRNTCDDYMVFVREPWVPTITLEYHGSASRTTLQDALTAYINGEVEDTFDDNDVETVLQALDNVTNVQVKSMTVVKYRKDGNEDTETADSFTLEDSKFQQFILFNNATHIAFTTDSD